MPNKDLHYLYVITTGILLFFGMVMYAMHQQNQAKTASLTEAVHFALEKGIEPLAVTCAYDTKTAPSALCVMYINRVQVTGDVSVPIVKK